MDPLSEATAVLQQTHSSPPPRNVVFDWFKYIHLPPSCRNVETSGRKLGTRLVNLWFRASLSYGTFQLFSGNRGQITEGFLERNALYFDDILSTQGYYHAVFFGFLGIVGTLYYWTVFASSKLKNKKKQKLEGFIYEDTELNVVRFIFVLLGTFAFYFIIFHSLSNLPLSDPLLYGVHQRFWMQVKPLFTFVIFC